MKKTILLYGSALLLLLHFAACTGMKKAPSPTPPQIAFKDTLHHMGVLSKAAPRDTFDFYFSNIGDSMLVVYRAEPSCECVTATFEQKPLLKGESSYIRVIYDGTEQSSGEIYRNVIIYSNAINTPCVLDIDGEQR